MVLSRLHFSPSLIAASSTLSPLCGPQHCNSCSGLRASLPFASVTVDPVEFLGFTLIELVYMTCLPSNLDCDVGKYTVYTG